MMETKFSMTHATLLPSWAKGWTKLPATISETRTNLAMSRRYGSLSIFMPNVSRYCWKEPSPISSATALGPEGMEP